jgi:transposase
MQLSDHDLKQLDDAYLGRLPMEPLRGLSSKLLADLKEARERLNQNPSNSSRPPSSQAPWENGEGPSQESAEEEDVS